MEAATVAAEDAEAMVAAVAAETKNGNQMTFPLEKVF
jgi:hypothetical protein